MPAFARQLVDALQRKTPTAVLLRNVLLFVAADVFFTGFAGAFAFTQYGVVGVMAFIAVQQTCSAVGYTAAFYLMRANETRPLQLQRLGVAGLFASMAAASLSPSALVTATTLCGLGGLCRGCAWSSRTWMELHHTHGAGRQAYLALAESAGVLVKMAGPLVSALVLFSSANDFQLLFAISGVAGLLLVAGMRGPALPTCVPQAIRPFEPWGRPGFYRTAPFYLLDGMGHALRVGLFTSGAMAVVGNAAAYGLIETGASMLAALLLAYQARRPRAQPSLGRLKRFLALLAIGWGCLIGALHWTVLLPAFVAAYAVGYPVVAVVKNGLTLGGLGQSGGSLHDNAIARIWLLLAARLTALGGATALVSWAGDMRLGLSLVVLLALCLMPLEYRFAKRVSAAATAVKGS